MWLKKAGCMSTLPIRSINTMRPLSTVPLAYDKWLPRDNERQSGRSLILLHGLFGSKTTHRSIARALARDLKTAVYCLDLRNHGESPHHPTHSYAAMAADVLQFIEDRNFREPPMVIGHSMGARATMALALMNPSSVSAIIPVDNGPHTVTPSPEFSRYIDGMRAVDNARVDTQKDMLDILEDYCSQLPVRQFLLTNFYRDKDATFRCRLPLDILESRSSDFTEFQPEKYVYNGPTLLIRGSRSKYAPDECLPLMHRLFPAVKVRDIDAGHWVISEKPVDVAREVKQFINDI